MSLRFQIVIVIALAGLLVVAWPWLSGETGGSESDRPRPGGSSAAQVLVEALELAEEQSSLRLVGTGKALRSASIYPKVAGEVVEVLFAAEQKVTAGQPLLRLDDEHAHLAVRLAQVAEREAGRQVKRVEKLAPSGTVSVVRLETARAEFESAGLRLAQARADLKDRTVYAPFDGVIGLSDVDKGDRVDEDTMIATLDDRSVIVIEFMVPEDYAGRLKLGEQLAVRPWTTADRSLTGTISALDSRIDRTTRSLRVQARIPNPDEEFRPGASFEVHLTFTGRPYPSVREVAVLWSRDGAYLWRVAEDKAEKVFVKMVSRDRGRVLVDGPLRAGDLIVVEGVQGLRDGQPVAPKPYGGVPAESGAS